MADAKEQFDVNIKKLKDTIDICDFRGSLHMVKDTVRGLAERRDEIGNIDYFKYMNIVYNVIQESKCICEKGGGMPEELRKKLEEIYPRLRELPHEELAQKDINYMNFLKRFKDTFSQISKEEFEKFMKEDIATLRIVVETNIDLWKKHRITITEMAHKIPEEISKDLDKESISLVNIVVSCLILAAKIEYERYKVTTEDFLLGRPNYDPTDPNAAFDEFVEEMMINYLYEDEVPRSFLIDLDPLIELLEKNINFWKRISEEEEFEVERPTLAIIADECAYLYSLIERII